MIKMKAIIPPDVNLSMSGIDKPVRDTLDEIQKKFARFTGTWRKQPSWVKKLTREFGKIIGEYSTDNPIVRFLVGGTKVRYATMTNPFAAKTAPRVLDSGAGVGGLLYVSTQHPRPGIEARDTDKEIKKEEEPLFKKRVDSWVKIFRQRSRHPA